MDYSDEDEDDNIGSIAGLGLSKVLASAGVDPNSFSNIFEKQGESSVRRFAEVEADDDNEDKYEDDISEGELGENDAESRAARERGQAVKKAEEERWYRRAVEMQRAATAGMGPASGGHDAADAAVNAKKKKEEEQLARIMGIWPEFEKGKRLKMTEVYYETPWDRKEYAEAFTRKKRRKLEVSHEYPLLVAPSSQANPLATWLLPHLPRVPLSDRNDPLYATPLGQNFDPIWIKGAREFRRRQAMIKPGGDQGKNGAKKIKSESKDKLEDDLPPGLAIELDEWEKNIVMYSGAVPPLDKPVEPLAPHNEILDSGDWTNQIIWDASRLSPGLLDSDEEDTKAPVKKLLLPALSANSRLDPFNLSNDHIYEHTREQRFRIRQTFGAIEVFHSGPAKALQLPYYKTSLSKTEARSWKRPAMQFPTGVSFTFSKLKSNPSAAVSSKKKQQMTDPSERFKTTKDLSMAEKGPYILLEFSEEYPPVMSGYGMGTTVVNYYRKTSENDEHVPKLDFGQPSILNVGDAEPCLLGYVDKGKVTQVIHNNLLRAPIFRHQPETTDFLVIRQTVNGHANYYIRPIANLYTVGQTLPNESEIPGPHARKNTTYARIRLQIVAWLLIQKSKQKRIKIGKLMKYFPDQTELQMRQRLKVKGSEFLIYNRSPGPHQGYWVLNSTLPSEKDGKQWPSTRQEVLEMATPEAAMLYEAMQVGARHLHDAGYSKTAEGKDDEDNGGDETGLDIEQQLAVWSTTLNYKKAEQQKAWLIVHGEGDPTGRGEGFSFLKTNMKNYFLRKGETEQGRRLEAEAKANGNPVKISNAEQNRIYEEEKRRVWDLQAKALGSSKPPQLEQEDEDRMAATPVAGTVPRYARGDSRRAMSRSGSMAATPMYAESPRDFSPGAMSADGESTFTGNPVAGKVLRIKRIIKGRTQYEIVRDPAVIASYRRRVEERKIEQYRTQTDMLQATGNIEEDELRRAALRQELENLKKNQARRMARKKYMNRDLGDDAENEGKRRCGACGQQGHTRANRACPMFNANNPGSVGPSPMSATPGGGGPTPGGFSTGGPTPGAFVGDYFGSGGGDGNVATASSTAIKIKLGGGQR